MTQTDKKSAMRVVWLCALTYFISYLTRQSYSAVVVNIAASTGISQTALAVAPMVSFITYGIGQLVSGYLGDRVQPKLLVSLGLSITVLMNFLLPFCTTAALMAVFWGINGMAQAFFWPPIVKLMLANLSEEDYRKNVQIVLWGSMVSTMCVYLVSTLLVSLLNWKFVFWFSTACGAAGLVVWLLLCPLVEFKKKEEESGEVENDENTQKLLSENGTNTQKTQKIEFAPVLLFMFAAIICMGALKDGVATWLPSYVSATFNLGSEISILSGAVLPVFTMLCYFVTGRLYKTKLKNPLLCAGVIFAVGFSAAAVLAVLTGVGATNVVVSVVLTALLTGCMHGVNFILVSMLPAYFRKKKNASTMAGLLNCSVYVGSSVSTFLFPLLAVDGNWGTTIISWSVISGLGTLICFLIVRPWENYRKKL